MPRKILAPHKEQDGYAYYRLPNSNIRRSLFVRTMEVIGMMRGMDEPWYPDDSPHQRIISSRRVEEAVETADFLKRCAEEGLVASWIRDYWLVYELAEPHQATGNTLREAYYRYKAEAELDAQQPGPFGDETEPVDDERYCFYCYFVDTAGGQPCHDCMNDDNAHDQYGDWTRPKWRPRND